MSTSPSRESSFLLPRLIRFVHDNMLLRFFPTSNVHSKAFSSKTFLQTRNISRIFLPDFSKKKLYTRISDSFLFRTTGR